MEDNQLSPPPESKENGPDNQRPWAIFCHLGALVMLLGVPLGNIWVPLILWLIKRRDMPAVERAGKQSVNFQLSMTLYTLIAFILCFVFVGFLLIFPIILLNVILVIYASIKESNGEEFTYPLTIRFIK